MTSEANCGTSIYQQDELGYHFSSMFVLVSTRHLTRPVSQRLSKVVCQGRFSQSVWPIS